MLLKRGSSYYVSLPICRLLLLQLTFIIYFFFFFLLIQVQLRYGWYRPDRPRSRFPCKFLRVTYSSKSLTSEAPCVTSSSHRLPRPPLGLPAHLDPADQLAVNNHLPVLLVLTHLWESYHYPLRCISLLLRLPRTM